MWACCSRLFQGKENAQTILNTLMSFLTPEFHKTRGIFQQAEAMFPSQGLCRGL